MEWKFNGLISCHELIDDDGSVAARIYAADRSGRARPYRAKSLISAFYYGERRLSALARRNKEWVSNRRDFTTEADRDRYVDRRKAAIMRFLGARKREQAGG